MRSFPKPAVTGKHSSQGSNQKKREGGPVAGPGNRLPNVAFRCSFHDSQRMRITSSRLEWGNNQDSLLRAQGHTCLGCL